MSNNSSTDVVLGIRIQPKIDNEDEVGKAIDKIVNGFQQEFNRVSKITWGEFEDYSHATYKDVSDTWEKTTKEMKGIAGKSLWGTVTAWFEDDMDQVEGIWDNAWDSMIGSADKAWDGFLNRAADRALSGLGSIFEKSVMDPATDWLSGALGLTGVDFDPKGKMEDFFAAVEMGDSVWEALDTADILPTSGITEAVASWFGGGGATTAAGIASELGPAGTLADIGLTSLAPTSAAMASELGAAGTLADLGLTSLAPVGAEAGAAAGLSAMAAPLALALGPGLLGMGLSQMGFLMDGPMTPEEAISNWQGQEQFLAGLSGNISGAGQDWAELGGTQFGLFGQAAQKAAEDLEHLKTVAGYTQQQLDGVVASLDPLSQELMSSGQAANSLEAEVRQLAGEINAAANSMSLTDQTTKGFNERIEELAGRLGLSGEAAWEFRDALYGLAQDFSAGGEEAASFESALDAFTEGTLASLTQGAEGSRQAIQGLIDSMKGVSGATGSSSAELGGGSFTAIDYASGGAVDSLGLYGGTSGGSAEYGYYHAGGLVGWPRAHAGALISSLARDEVPIVARRGEYVVRAEAVNAATLPALKALNQGGGVGQAAPVVNLHVEIHGNFLGKEDNLEDLARLLEGKLRDLAANRWKG